jgi:hypothetical protein
MREMFKGVTLSVSNYNSLLLGWANLTLQANITFHAGNSYYSDAAIDARNYIIGNFGWTIIDGGLKPDKAIPGYSIIISLSLFSLIIIYLVKRKNKCIA